MKENDGRRSVRMELELRVTYPDEPGRLERILKVLRESGGSIEAHMIYRVDRSSVGLFVCKEPAEAALALQREGFAMETETVVLVETENRTGALASLVSTLEGERIGIAYSYATSKGRDLLIVISTDDNPKSEDVLRNYLRLQDGVTGLSPPAPTPFAPAPAGTYQPRSSPNLSS